MSSSESESGRPDRYSRQELLPVIGVDGQRRLRAARVLVVGCGALGTVSAELLARAGVGSLVLVDRDIVEWSNLQRQIGFVESDARDGRPKAIALAEHLSRVNSEVDIRPHAVEFRFPNATELAADCDLILDGTDNVPTRLLVNEVSYDRSVPWVYGGAIGTDGHVLLLDGRSSPCLRCYLGTPPPAGTLATCDTAGVLGPSVAAVASLQASMALRALATGDTDELRGRLWQLDNWNARWRESRVEGDPACPVCIQGRREFLEGHSGADDTELCGRDAVQVRPLRPPDGPADLASIAVRLAGHGDVELHRHYLRLSDEGYRMTLFVDLRAVFDGLTDTARARSLYSRLVGE